MPNDPGSTNRRIYDRYALDKGVEIIDGERRRGGRLRDISGGGAAVIHDGEADDHDEPLEAGRYVDIDVDDVGFYGGEVIREIEEGYAVRFDLDESERGELISEILEHGIAIDD